ncbi:MAG: aminotransferase class V-fold PLP-dependent enzyme [Clostridia bacterium]|nr:aminotransferase class V-fold PLP-dependent enzyme [Clostridia bacterium]
MVYLDNAATSFPKPDCIIRDLNFCLRKYCGNPGRSGHTLSIEAGERIYEVRELIADFLNYENPECVVFTYNATYALNLAIKTKITKKCHIIISDTEHNAVFRPIESLKERLGVEYSVFESGGDIRSSIEGAIRNDTECIISTLQSNVTGRRIPLEILSSVAKKHGLYLIVDASQAIGHEKIDLKKTPCDVLCAPGHKALFGIQGGGFAVFKSKERLSSFIEGGSGSESKMPYMPRRLPEGYEAGTLSTPAIITLGSGIRYINGVGLDSIEAKCSYFSKKIKDTLDIPKRIRLYESFGSIVLFNIIGKDSDTVTQMLDKEGICVRGGLHCAPMAHRLLSTEDGGAVRVSLSYLNSERDVDLFGKTVKKILAE